MSLVENVHADSLRPYRQYILYAVVVGTAPAVCILQTERPAGGITTYTLTVFPNFTLVI